MPVYVPQPNESLNPFVCVSIRDKANMLSLQVAPKLCKPVSLGSGSRFDRATKIRYTIAREVGQLNSYCIRAYLKCTIMSLCIVMRMPLQDERRQSRRIVSIIATFASPAASWPARWYG